MVDFDKLKFYLQNLPSYKSESEILGYSVDNVPKKEHIIYIR